MIAPGLILVALVGAWELYAVLGRVDPVILAAPHQIAQALWSDAGLLWPAFRVTAEEIVLGMLAAIAAGLLLAGAIHFSRVLRRALYPLLVGAQTVPIVIVAPLLVFWWGFGLAPKVAIVALVCFFPVVVPLLDALAGVDPERRKLMRSLDASRWQTFRHVEAPSALPAALSGVKIAVITSVIGAVLAEQGSASEGTGGLGRLITNANGQLDTAQGYAAVVLLAVFALLLFWLLHVAERRLVPWSRPAREELSA